jgi:glycosyltransferase involved in cell wall biosynthesis
LEPLVTIAISDLANQTALSTTLAALDQHTPEPHEIVLFVQQGQKRNVPEGIYCIEVPSPFATPTALNLLVASCATPYILLLEAGIRVTSSWLARLLEPLQEADVGLSGPSTNLSWNEQQVLSRFAGARYSSEQIDALAFSVATRYAGQRRSLNTLHNLADFCYLFKRAVAQDVGGFDEAYGSGPCWEIDFTTRAAHAGYRAMWAMDAYVHRSQTVQRPLDVSLFTRNKHLYQDRFCGLKLTGQKTTYEPHCRGEACPHFAPTKLINIHLERNVTTPPAATMSAVSTFITMQSVAHESNTKPQEEQRGAYATLPLVSCIMPTRNRRAFVQQALAYFERQDYPNKELVVVDDGEDQVADLVAGRPDVHYVAQSQKLSIGAKRNLACQLAQGGIIAHWDDDDWYAPHRLSYQVAPLLTGQADITGLETPCFFDVQRWQAWTCSPALHRRLFVGDVHGGTLVYWRRVWEHLTRYPNLSIAEDARFLLAACQRQARLQKLAHAQCFVYLRHGGNAWHFPLGSYLDPSGWQKIDLNTFLPEQEQSFYRALSHQSGTGPTPTRHGTTSGNHGLLPGSIVVSDRDEAAPVAAVYTNSVQDGRPNTPDRFPLVSCIMPTYNRQRYVEQSIQYFLRQDYPDRELIILDDSPQHIDHLIPADPRIRYVHLDSRMILGAKRNLACRLAHGSIIAHWDDDDWIATRRLRIQVDLLERQHAELCGTYRQLYYDSGNQQAWLYEYPHIARRLPLGNTLCYRRSLWERNPFSEIAVGEDTRFVWSRLVRSVAFLEDYSFYVGLIHRGNTSRKILTGTCWHARPIEEVYNLLGADADFYRSNVLGV